MYGNGKSIFKVSVLAAVLLMAATPGRALDSGQDGGGGAATGGSFVFYLPVPVNGTGVATGTGSTSFYINMAAEAGADHIYPSTDAVNYIDGNKQPATAPLAAAGGTWPANKFALDMFTAANADPTQQIFYPTVKQNSNALSRLQDINITTKTSGNSNIFSMVATLAGNAGVFNTWKVGDSFGFTLNADTFNDSVPDPQPTQNYTWTFIIVADTDSASIQWLQGTNNIANGGKVNAWVSAGGAGTSTFAPASFSLNYANTPLFYGPINGWGKRVPFVSGNSAASAGFDNALPVFFVGNAAANNPFFFDANAVGSTNISVVPTFTPPATAIGNYVGGSWTFEVSPTGPSSAINFVGKTIPVTLATAFTQFLESNAIPANNNLPKTNMTLNIAFKTLTAKVVFNKVYTDAVNSKPATDYYPRGWSKVGNNDVVEFIVTFVDEAGAAAKLSAADVASMQPIFDGNVASLSSRNGAAVALDPAGIDGNQVFMRVALNANAPVMDYDVIAGNSIYLRTINNVKLDGVTQPIIADATTQTDVNIPRYDNVAPRKNLTIEVQPGNGTTLVSGNNVITGNFVNYFASVGNAGTESLDINSLSTVRPNFNVTALDGSPSVAAVTAAILANTTVTIPAIPGGNIPNRQAGYAIFTVDFASVITTIGAAAANYKYSIKLNSSTPITNYNLIADLAGNKYIDGVAGIIVDPTTTIILDKSVAKALLDSPVPASGSNIVFSTTTPGTKTITFKILTNNAGTASSGSTNVGARALLNVLRFYEGANLVIGSGIPGIVGDTASAASGSFTIPIGAGAGANTYAVDIVNNNDGAYNVSMLFTPGTIATPFDLKVVLAANSLYTIGGSKNLPASDSILSWNISQKNVALTGIDITNIVQKINTTDNYNFTTYVNFNTANRYVKKGDLITWVVNFDTGMDTAIALTSSNISFGNNAELVSATWDVTGTKLTIIGRVTATTPTTNGGVTSICITSIAGLKPAAAAGYADTIKFDYNWALGTPITDLQIALPAPTLDTVLPSANNSQLRLNGNENNLEINLKDFVNPSGTQANLTLTYRVLLQDQKAALNLLAAERNDLFDAETIKKNLVPVFVGSGGVTNLTNGVVATFNTAATNAIAQLITPVGGNNFWSIDIPLVISIPSSDFASLATSPVTVWIDKYADSAAKIADTAGNNLNYTNLLPNAKGGVSPTDQIKVTLKYDNTTPSISFAQAGGYPAYPTYVAGNDATITNYLSATSPIPAKTISFMVETSNVGTTASGATPITAGNLMDNIVFTLDNVTRTLGDKVYINDDSSTASIGGFVTAGNYSVVRDSSNANKFLVTINTSTFVDGQSLIISLPNGIFYTLGTNNRNLPAPGQNNAYAFKFTVKSVNVSSVTVTNIKQTVNGVITNYTNLNDFKNSLKRYVKPAGGTVVADEITIQVVFDTPMAATLPAITVINGTVISRTWDANDPQVLYIVAKVAAGTTSQSGALAQIYLSAITDAYPGSTIGFPTGTKFSWSWAGGAGFSAPALNTLITAASSPSIDNIAPSSANSVLRINESIVGNVNDPNIFAEVNMASNGDNTALIIFTLYLQDLSQGGAAEIIDSDTLNNLKLKFDSANADLKTAFNNATYGLPTLTQAAALGNFIKIDLPVHITLPNAETVLGSNTIRVTVTGWDGANLVADMAGNNLSAPTALAIRGSNQSNPIYADVKYVKPVAPHIGFFSSTLTPYNTNTGVGINPMTISAGMADNMRTINFQVRSYNAFYDDAGVKKIVTKASTLKPAIKIYKNDIDISSAPADPNGILDTNTDFNVSTGVLQSDGSYLFTVTLKFNTITSQFPLDSTTNVKIILPPNTFFANAAATVATLPAIGATDNAYQFAITNKVVAVDSISIFSIAQDGVTYGQAGGKTIQDFFSNNRRVKPADVVVYHFHFNAMMDTTKVVPASAITPNAHCSISGVKPPVWIDGQTLEVTVIPSSSTPRNYFNTTGAGAINNYLLFTSIAAMTPATGLGFPAGYTTAIQTFDQATLMPVNGRLQLDNIAPAILNAAVTPTGPGVNAGGNTATVNAIITYPLLFNIAFNPTVYEGLDDESVANNLRLSFANTSNAALNARLADPSYQTASVDPSAPYSVNVTLDVANLINGLNLTTPFSLAVNNSLANGWKLVKDRAGNAMQIPTLGDVTPLTIDPAASHIFLTSPLPNQVNYIPGDDSTIVDLYYPFSVVGNTDQTITFYIDMKKIATTSTNATAGTIATANNSIIDANSIMGKLKIFDVTRNKSLALSVVNATTATYLSDYTIAELPTNPGDDLTVEVTLKIKLTAGANIYDADLTRDTVISFGFDKNTLFQLNSGLATPAADVKYAYRIIRKEPPAPVVTEVWASQVNGNSITISDIPNLYLKNGDVVLYNVTFDTALDPAVPCTITPWSWSSDGLIFETANRVRNYTLSADGKSATFEVEVNCTLMSDYGTVPYYSLVIASITGGVSLDGKLMTPYTNAPANPPIRIDNRAPSFNYLGLNGDQNMNGTATPAVGANILSYTMTPATNAILFQLNAQDTERFLSTSLNNFRLVFSDASLNQLPQIVRLHPTLNSIVLVNLDISSLATLFDGRTAVLNVIGFGNTSNLVTDLAGNPLDVTIVPTGPTISIDYNTAGVMMSIDPATIEYLNGAAAAAQSISFNVKTKSVVIPDASNNNSKYSGSFTGGAGAQDPKGATILDALLEGASLPIANLAAYIDSLSAKAGVTQTDGSVVYAITVTIKSNAVTTSDVELHLGIQQGLFTSIFGSAIMAPATYITKGIVLYAGNPKAYLEMAASGENTQTGNGTAYVGVGPKTVRFIASRPVTKPTPNCFESTGVTINNDFTPVGATITKNGIIYASEWNFTVNYPTQVTTMQFRLRKTTEAGNIIVDMAGLKPYNCATAGNPNYYMFLVYSTAGDAYIKFNPETVIYINETTPNIRIPISSIGLDLSGANKPADSATVLANVQLVTGTEGVANKMLTMSAFVSAISSINGSSFGALSATVSKDGKYQGDITLNFTANIANNTASAVDGATREFYIEPAAFPIVGNANTKLPLERLTRQAILLKDPTIYDIYWKTYYTDATTISPWVKTNTATDLTARLIFNRPVQPLTISDFDLPTQVKINSVTPTPGMAAVVINGGNYYTDFTVNFDLININNVTGNVLKLRRGAALDASGRGITTGNAASQNDADAKKMVFFLDTTKPMLNSFYFCKADGTKIENGSIITSGTGVPPLYVYASFNEEVVDLPINAIKFIDNNGQVIDWSVNLISAPRVTSFANNTIFIIEIYPKTPHTAEGLYIGLYLDSTQGLITDLAGNPLDRDSYPAYVTYKSDELFIFQSLASVADVNAIDNRYLNSAPVSFLATPSNASAFFNNSPSYAGFTAGLLSMRPSFVTVKVDDVLETSWSSIPTLNVLAYNNASALIADPTNEASAYFNYAIAPATALEGKKFEIAVASSQVASDAAGTKFNILPSNSLTFYFDATKPTITLVNQNYIDPADPFIMLDIFDKSIDVNRIDEHFNLELIKIYAYKTAGVDEEVISINAVSFVELVRPNTYRFRFNIATPPSGWVGLKNSGKTNTGIGIKARFVKDLAGNFNAVKNVDGPKIEALPFLSITANPAVGMVGNSQAFNFVFSIDVAGVDVNKLKISLHRGEGEEEQIFNTTPTEWNSILSAKNGFRTIDGANYRLTLAGTQKIGGQLPQDGDKVVLEVTDPATLVNLPLSNAVPPTCEVYYSDSTPHLTNIVVDTSGTTGQFYPAVTSGENQHPSAYFMRFVSNGINKLSYRLTTSEKVSMTKPADTLLKPVFSIPGVLENWLVGATSMYTKIDTNGTTITTTSYVNNGDNGILSLTGFAYAGSNAPGVIRDNSNVPLDFYYQGTDELIAAANAQYTLVVDTTAPVIEPVSSTFNRNDRSFMIRITDDNPAWVANKYKLINPDLLKVKVDNNTLVNPVPYNAASITLVKDNIYKISMESAAGLIPANNAADVTVSIMPNFVYDLAGNSNLGPNDGILNFNLVPTDLPEMIIWTTTNPVSPILDSSNKAANMIVNFTVTATGKVVNSQYISVNLWKQGATEPVEVSRSGIQAMFTATTWKLTPATPATYSQYTLTFPVNTPIDGYYLMSGDRIEFFVKDTSIGNIIDGGLAEAPDPCMIKIDGQVPMPTIKLLPNDPSATANRTMVFEIDFGMAVRKTTSTNFIASDFVGTYWASYAVLMPKILNQSFTLTVTIPEPVAGDPYSQGTWVPGQGYVMNFSPGKPVKSIMVSAGTNVTSMAGVASIPVTRTYNFDRDNPNILVISPPSGSTINLGNAIVSESNFRTEDVATGRRAIIAFRFDEPVTRTGQDINTPDPVGENFVDLFRIYFNNVMVPDEQVTVTHNPNDYSMFSMIITGLSGMGTLEIEWDLPFVLSDAAGNTYPDGTPEQMKLATYNITTESGIKQPQVLVLTSASDPIVLHAWVGDVKVLHNLSYDFYTDSLYGMSYALYADDQATVPLTMPYGDTTMVLAPNGELSVNDPQQTANITFVARATNLGTDASYGPSAPVYFRLEIEDKVIVPTVTLEVATPTVVEGGLPGRFMINRNLAKGKTTVKFMMQGTATYGDDYTLTSNGIALQPQIGYWDVNTQYTYEYFEVSIPAGLTAIDVSVNALLDGITEDDETITLFLWEGVNSITWTDVDDYDPIQLVPADGKVTMTLIENPGSKPQVYIVTNTPHAMGDGSQSGYFSIHSSMAAVADYNVKLTTSGMAVRGTNYDLYVNNVLLITPVVTMPANATQVEVEVRPIVGSITRDMTATFTIIDDAAYILGAPLSCSVIIMQVGTDDPDLNVTVTNGALEGDTYVLPRQTAAMYANVSNYPENQISYNWSVTDNPTGASIIFDPSNTAKSPLIGFSVEGLYTVTCTVTTTGGFTSSQDIKVQATKNIINNQQPIINDIYYANTTTPISAQTVLDSNILAVTADAYDPDGDVIFYTWLALSGPGTFIASPDIHAQTVSLRFTASGTYEMQLKVDDGIGAPVTRNFVVIATVPVNPDDDPIGDFIVRGYNIALGRQPEEYGFNYYHLALSSQSMCADEFVYNVMMSQEYNDLKTTNYQFVLTLYQFILDRMPDDYGMQGWLNVLSQYEYDREDVVAGFMQASEFDHLAQNYGIKPYGDTVINRQKVRNFVRALYTNFLSRPADRGGLNAWSGLLIDKTITGRVCADGFYYSQEFQADMKEMNNSDYLECLYKALLGRPSDVTGKTEWMAKLDSGMPRVDVYQNFQLSAEFSKMCADAGFLP